MTENRAILALDVTADRCAAALSIGERVYERSERMARGHAERLFPMIAELTTESGRALSEIDLFVALSGPGSFTGVRLGVAAARGLALGAGGRAIGVDGFSALAWAAARAGREGAALAAFGKPPRLLGRRFMLAGGRARALGPVEALSPEAMAAATRDLMIGPGAADLGAAEFSEPDPAVVAAIAAEGLDGAGPPTPLYLRPPDAEPSKETRPRRLGPRPAA